MKSLLIPWQIVLLTFSTILAQPHEYIEPLSEILQTGHYNEIVIEDEWLYASTSYGFDIVDISDPDEPALLARIPSKDDSEDIAVRDGFVYLTDWTFGVHCYDARDPENVTEVWSYPPEPIALTLFEDVKVHQNRLYVCAWNIGVLIFNISEPGEPRYLATFEGLPLPSAITFKDDITFISDNAFESIFPVDLRDLENITVYNLVRSSGRLEDLLAYGDLLFSCRGPLGLSIFGIEFPTQPTRFRSMALDGWTNSVAGRGNHIYVGCGDGGLVVMDVSDQLNPQIAFTNDTTFYYTQNTVFLNNERAYVAGNWDGMGIYDFSDPEEPELIDIFNPLLPSVYRLTVQEQTIYVPRYNDGLLVINADDPTSPEIIAMIDTAHVGRVFATEDNWLYLTGLSGEEMTPYLQAWDIRDPQNPEATFYQEIEDAFPDIDIMDEMLCFSYYDSHIELWDISRPEDPTFINRIEDVPCRYACLGIDFLYTVGAEHTFAIIDLIAPEDPVVVGQFDELEWGFGLDVHGSCAFVADGNNGVSVLNVSSPNRIRQEGIIQTVDWAYNVTLDDTLLYVMDADGGVRVYDITPDRGYPEVGWLDTPGCSMFAEVEDGICYLADYYDLTICRFDPATAAPGYRSTTPNGYVLYPAFPNPFNGTVHIPFTLPRLSEVGVTIFDPNGRVIYQSSGVYPAGKQRLCWNGMGYPSGSYIFMLNVKEIDDRIPVYKSRQKLMLVK